MMLMVPGIKLSRRSQRDNRCYEPSASLGTWLFLTRRRSSEALFHGEGGQAGP
jgi:hypothetical protein